MFDQEQGCSAKNFSSPGIGLYPSNDVQARTDHLATASNGPQDDNSGSMTINVQHATSKINNVNHETSKINNVNHETSKINNVNHETSKINSVNHETSTMNNVDHETSMMNIVDHAAPTMNYVNHEASTMNNVDHETLMRNNDDRMISTVGNIGNATANCSWNVHSAHHTTADNGSAVSDVDHATADSTSTTKLRPCTVFRFSKGELEVLEREFLRNGFPKIGRRKEIAFSIQKKERQVRDWFIRRMRRNKKRGCAKSCRSVPSPLHEKNANSSAARPMSSTHVDQRTPEVIPNWIHHRSELYPHSSLGEERFINPSHDPIQGQENQVRIRGKPFIPNYYREINSDGVQPQPSDRQASEDRHHSPSNQSATMLVQAPGQEVEIRDISIPEQEHQVIIRGHSFIPNYYREINRVPPLPDDRQASEDHRHSPVNQSATMLVQAPSQEVEIGDIPTPGQEHQVRFTGQPFIPNYYREINIDRVQPLPSDKQASKDRCHSPVNESATTCRQAAGLEVGIRDIPIPGQEHQVRIRGHSFIPNYHTEINNDRVQKQPMPDGRQASEDHRHSPVNQSATRCRPTPGQEVKIKDKPIPGQEHQVRIRGQPFIPNYYREINSDRIQQQPLPDDGHTCEDRFHSPVNQTATRHCPDASQEVEIKDKPLIPNHCKEIDVDKKGAQRQQQLLKEQQAGKDPFLTDQ